MLNLDTSLITDGVSQSSSFLLDIFNTKNNPIFSEVFNSFSSYKQKNSASSEQIKEGTSLNPKAITPNVGISNAITSNIDVTKEITPNVGVSKAITSNVEVPKASLENQKINGAIIEAESEGISNPNAEIYNPILENEKIRLDF